MLNSKKIDPLEIARDYASKGLIPEDCIEDFADGIRHELKSASHRFGADHAEIVSRYFLIHNHMENSSKLAA